LFLASARRTFSCFNTERRKGGRVDGFPLEELAQIVNGDGRVFGKLLQCFQYIVQGDPFIRKEARTTVLGYSQMNDGLRREADLLCQRGLAGDGGAGGGREDFHVLVACRLFHGCSPFGIIERV
jgi:hypothetical protein